MLGLLLRQQRLHRHAIQSDTPKLFEQAVVRLKLPASPARVCGLFFYSGLDAVSLEPAISQIELMEQGRRLAMEPLNHPQVAADAIRFGWIAARCFIEQA
jgi:hypothetical protein